MLLETFKQFKDFELLDTGGGYRLERWGDVVLARPDPQIIWAKHLPQTAWDNAHGTFIADGEKGQWKIHKPIPKSWFVTWEDVTLKARLTPFKHTGIFAEQAANWEWILTKLKVESRKLKVLNLFAYTGAVSVVLAKAGCFVTHVDASKPAIAWAKDNHRLNNLADDSIRWILDDAAKFVARELKRGQQYDGIIMDPPAFGHSPSGKVWKFNHDIPKLLADCAGLLSPQARFLFVNAYATNASALSLNNLLEDTLKNNSGHIEYGELCLKQKNNRLISTGIFARWQGKN